jgi:hypothetical protein
MMARISSTARWLAVVGLIWLGTDFLGAQPAGNGNNNRNRGNRDPGQYQERRLARYREQLEITNDEEWKAIQPLIEKVLQLQQEIRALTYGGGGRGGGPGGSQNQSFRTRGGRGNRADNSQNAQSETNSELGSLQQAVNSKAPPAELKARLTKLRQTLKQKEAGLTNAQEDLRQVFTTRQEAVAVLNGLLR